jgi:uncharacterized membrane protein
MTIGEARPTLERALSEHGHRFGDGRNVLTRTAARHATFAAWFGLGLGLAELVAPEAVTELVGAKDGRSSRATLRAFGLREIASSFGLFAGRHRARWLWARFVGDLIDLAALGKASTDSRDDGRLAVATTAVAMIAALDAGAALALRKTPLGRAPEGVQVRKTITVNRPVEEVYRFFRHFENLPKFMMHLESVSSSGRTSHWKARGPAHVGVEWDAEIVQDIPGELIAWRSTTGSVANQGAVRFRVAPGNRGTEVHVHLRYDPPLGEAGATLAKLFGQEPGQQIAGDLRRFKQLMETGSVMHSDASVHPFLHAARPLCGLADETNPHRKDEP